VDSRPERLEGTVLSSEEAVAITADHLFENAHGLRPMLLAVQRNMSFQVVDHIGCICGENTPACKQGSEHLGNGVLAAEQEVSGDLFRMSLPRQSDIWMYELAYIPGYPLRIEGGYEPA